MRRVRWAQAAVSDLDDIQAYLSEAYTSDYAQFVIERLVLATDWLLEHPNAGAPLEHPPWRKWKPRRTRYILIYEPIPDGIDVARIRHDQNDWRLVPQ